MSFMKLVYNVYTVYRFQKPSGVFRGSESHETLSPLDAPFIERFGALYKTKQMQ